MPTKFQIFKHWLKFKTTPLRKWLFQALFSDFIQAETDSIFAAVDRDLEDLKETVDSLDQDSCGMVSKGDFEELERSVEELEETINADLDNRVTDVEEKVKLALEAVLKHEQGLR